MSNRGHSAPCFLDVTKEACKGGRDGHGHPRTPPPLRIVHLCALYYSVLHVVANAYHDHDLTVTI